MQQPAVAHLAGPSLPLYVYRIAYGCVLTVYLDGWMFN